MEVLGFEMNAADMISDTFVRRKIQKGRYAVFTHHGGLQTLSQTINYIWGTWILSTKEVLASRDSLSCMMSGFTVMLMRIQKLIFMWRYNESSYIGEWIHTYKNVLFAYACL
ncbi:MAG: GyrI-like domain-containing protein [[Clostridium] innocuum]